AALVSIRWHVRWLASDWLTAAPHGPGHTAPHLANGAGAGGLVERAYLRGDRVNTGDVIGRSWLHGTTAGGHSRGARAARRYGSAGGAPRGARPSSPPDEPHHAAGIRSVGARRGRCRWHRGGVQR